MKLRNLILPEKKIYNIIFYIVIGVITLILGIGLANVETNTDVSVLLPVNKDTEFEREKIRRLEVKKLGRRAHRYDSRVV